jgi:hypothetical protein
MQEPERKFSGDKARPRFLAYTPELQSNRRAMDMRISSRISFGGKGFLQILDPMKVAAAGQFKCSFKDGLLRHLVLLPPPGKIARL